MTVFGTSITLAAFSLFIERLFPLGDWRWILVMLVGLSPWILVYRRKLFDWGKLSWKDDVNIKTESNPVPKRERDTPEVNWQEAEDRFGFIDGELDATWNKYDDGPVEWYIKPVGSDTDGRREKRFIIEARWLGRKLKGRRDVPRLFPNAVLDDPAHEWLNVVGANVAPSSIAGVGYLKNRRYTWGCLDRVVDASKLTCRHFARKED